MFDLDLPTNLSLHTEGSDEDRWETIGEFEVCDTAEHPVDLNDPCQAFEITLTVDVASDASENEIARALMACLSTEPCSHDHAACGCRRTTAVSAIRNSDARWTVVQTSQRQMPSDQGFPLARN